MYVRKIIDRKGLQRYSHHDDLDQKYKYLMPTQELANNSEWQISKERNNSVKQEVQ